MATKINSKLPRLDSAMPIVNDNKTPSSSFHVWWQTVVNAIDSAVGSLSTMVTEIQEAILKADKAQVAAGEAKLFAIDAVEIAGTAETTAGTAATVSLDALKIAKLSTSGTFGATITAKDEGLDCSISISAHSRFYTSGEVVALNAGTVTNVGHSTDYYVYYDDPLMSGGSVIYRATSNLAIAVQAGSRHLVGRVPTPGMLGPDNVGYPLVAPGRNLL